MIKELTDDLMLKIVTDYHQRQAISSATCKSLNYSVKMKELSTLSKNMEGNPKYHLLVQQEMSLEALRIIRGSLARIFWPVLMTLASKYPDGQSSEICLHRVSMETTIEVSNVPKQGMLNLSNFLKRDLDKNSNHSLVR